MLVGQIRLDRTRYIVRTGDRILQTYEVGSQEYKFYRTEKGHLLICLDEEYTCEGECPDKGRTFTMIKAIKNKEGNFIPATYLEKLINEKNIDSETLMLIIDTYCDKYEDETILNAVNTIAEKYPMFGF